MYYQVRIINNPFPFTAKLQKIETVSKKFIFNIHFMPKNHRINVGLFLNLLFGSFLFQVAVEMFLHEIQDEQRRCGWKITSSIIMLQFLWPKIYHLESK